SVPSPRDRKACVAPPVVADPATRPAMLTALPWLWSPPGRTPRSVTTYRKSARAGVAGASTSARPRHAHRTGLADIGTSPSKRDALARLLRRMAAFATPNLIVLGQRLQAICDDFAAGRTAPRRPGCRSVVDPRTITGRPGGQDPARPWLLR